MLARVRSDRRIVGAVLLIAIAVAVSMDFATAMWRDYPMLGSIVSAGLLLGITLLWIEEWIARREAARWRRVGFALVEAITGEAKRLHEELVEFIVREAGCEPEHHGHGPLLRLLVETYERDRTVSLRLRHLSTELVREFNVFLGAWSSLLISSDELTELFNTLPRLGDAVSRFGRSLPLPHTGRERDDGSIITMWLQIDYELARLMERTDALFPDREVVLAKRDEQREFLRYLQDEGIALGDLRRARLT